MKNLKAAWILGAAVALTILGGCDFKEGIEKPSLPIDQTLLGTWSCKESDDTINVTLFRKDDLRYAGIAWPDSEPEKPEGFIASLSSVGGATFLSVDMGKDEENPFLYIRLTRIDGKSLRYEKVSPDSAFARDLAGTIKERLTRHLKDADLFMAAKTFVKKS